MTFKILRKNLSAVLYVNERGLTVKLNVSMQMTAKGLQTFFLSRHEISFTQKLVCFNPNKCSQTLLSANSMKAFNLHSFDNYRK